MVPQFPESVRTAFVSFFIVIGIASLLSNCLIIHGVRVNPYMHTTTNYFILNMAVGDIVASLISVSYTFYFTYHGAVWSSGIIGRLTCKSVFFIQVVSMYCSIYSLVAITFDRFMAVFRPLRYKYSSRWTRYILPLIWLVCLAIPVQPVFNRFDLKLLNGTTYCLPDPSTDNQLIIFIVGYCIPEVIIVIMYSLIAYKLCTRKIPGNVTSADKAAHRTAKKVTIMIVFTFIAFNLTWGPQFIYSLICFFSLSSCITYASLLASYITTLLINCNGSFNAMIYAFFNEQFRAAFKAALRRHHEVQSTTTGQLPKSTKVISSHL